MQNPKKKGINILDISTSYILSSFIKVFNVKNSTNAFMTTSIRLTTDKILADDIKPIVLYEHISVIAFYILSDRFQRLNLV